MLPTQKELAINSKENSALKTAIRYYQSRHSYVSDDIILSIIGKLNDDIVFILNLQELNYLLRILEDNINHIKKTDYPGLSKEYIESRRKENLEPLISMQNKASGFN